MVETNRVQVFVYGAEQVCASCVNLPSSQETAAWLHAALGRKFGDQVEIVYVDIFAPQGEKEEAFARRVIEEDLWYPVVVINDEIVDEGNPKLKKIVQKLEELGLQLVS
ncbi:YuzD family protein [Thermoflavimicrobium dichotomicum]|uniref:Disulfide oxidoreductase YuzD n=1 Tax=Thermoflavimicrobium dichotomicum TaxID=46223 RepID=A0A1I3LPR2_9BACL|nr:YuzD family protein [Thermoflavimicrobium dichotomicum]SFI86682.1 Disulfide oxidoreductase YuzD [Thermoflavimicrobium dichotomicum]